MSRESKIVILWLLVAGIFLYADHTFQKNTGPHGGQYKEDKPYYIELRKENQTLYSYLLDADKKPLQNSGIHCDGKLSYADGTIQNIKFIPYKEDGFIAQGISTSYAACAISFFIKDRTVKAIFENDQLFAKKNNNGKRTN